MGITDLPHKVLKKYRDEGFVPLLKYGKLFFRGHSRKYFEDLIAKRILWGDSQFHTYTQWWYYINQKRFIAPADPFRTIVVNPQEIGVYNTVIGKRWGLSRIVGGKWDQEIHRKQLTRNWIFKGLKQRFVEGLEWEETDYYKTAEREFQHGKLMWGYMNLDQFLKIRCGYVDDLYESIRQNGYRPNRISKHENPCADIRSKETVYIHQLEPLVVIGRNGTIYWSDGYHRATIAQIIGLKQLPVQILCRHKGWQQVRDTIARAEAPEVLTGELRNYLDHPDLIDVVPKSWQI